MNQAYYLGDWYVEPDLHRISCGDESARLQPKMLAVLEVLVQNEGRTVEKSELLDLVWPRQYVYEEVLKRVILKLRQALGDDSRNPRYIETIHKRGYRLMCPVRADESVGTPGAVEWDGGSPFRSLEHFEVDDRSIFFGRTTAVDEARAALEEQHERGQGFLLICGASGAGKSSFARAGLIPALMRERGLTSKEISVLHPSEFLHPPADTLTDRLFREIESDDAALPEARQALPLLLIDQLEEGLEQETSGELMARIHQLARSGLADVIVTLREDFLPVLNEWPVVVRLKQGAGTLTLGSPSQSELAEILQGPAGVAGFRYEISEQFGSLKQAILTEAASERHALPLLQFLLHRMYEQRQDGLLTWESYQALGGLAGAISIHANHVMQRLDAEAQTALPSLLERLTRFDLDHQRVTRNPAPLKELMEDRGLAALANALIEERLLVRRTGAGQEASLTLAHESLLRSWRRARLWVNENLERLAALRRLQMAQANWQRAAQSPDLLLRAGKALADGESVLCLHGLEPGIRSYVRLSRARVNRRVLVRRLAVASLTALSIMAVATGYVANRQRAAAENNLALAERATNFVIGLFDTTRPNSGTESITAREMLDEGVRRIPLEFAEDPLNRGRLLHATGKLYLQMGEMDRAEELLTLALQDSPEHSRERYEYAWSLAELRVARNHQIADAEADRLLRLAIESLERSGAGDSEIASAYWRAASLAQPEWRYSPHYWEQAYQRFASPALAEDPNAPEMLAHFAVVLAYERMEPINLRDTDRALALFRQSLAMYENQQRIEDVRYLETLENAAVVEYSVGSSLQAIEFQRRAAEGSLGVLGRLHIATPFRWQTLGEYLLVEGFYTEAENALQEAASMFLDAYGAETPKWFETSISLAEAWFRVGRFGEVRQLLNVLAAKQEQVWKVNDHPKTWRLWHLRGHLARSAGDIPAAASAYRMALQRISRMASDGNKVRERIRVELDAMFAESSRDYSGFTQNYLDKEASWPKVTGNSYRRDSLRPNTEMLMALVRLGCDNPYGMKAAEYLSDRIRKTWQNANWYAPAAENALAACGQIDLPENEFNANARRVSELTHPATYMAIEAARSTIQLPTLAKGSDSP